VPPTVDPLPHDAGMYGKPNQPTPRQLEAMQRQQSRPLCTHRPVNPPTEDRSSVILAIGVRVAFEVALAHMKAGGVAWMAGRPTMRFTWLHGCLREVVGSDMGHFPAIAPNNNMLACAWILEPKSSP
jgi:hypothetical protein